MAAVENNYTVRPAIDKISFFSMHAHRSRDLPNSSSLISFCFVAFSVASVLSMARLLWTASFSALLRAQPILKIVLSLLLCFSFLAQPVNWRDSSFSGLQKKKSFLLYTHSSDPTITHVYDQLLPKLSSASYKYSTHTRTVFFRSDRLVCGFYSFLIFSCSTA